MKTKRARRFGGYGGLSVAMSVIMTIAPFRSASAAEASVTTVDTVRIARASLSQPVQAYGVIGLAASRLTTVSLAYPARILHIRIQPGQRVQRGAPIALVQADPAAVAVMEQAKSAVQAARSELQRTEALYAETLATQSQLDAARKALSDARTSLDAQRRLGVDAGTLTIAAPANGVVTQLAVTQGDRLQAGAAIAQIAAADGGHPASVSLSVDPSDVGWIRAGDAVTVRTLAAPQAQRVATGRVTLVGQAVDPQTQMTDIGAAVPPDAGLLPGTRVKAEIATRTGLYWVVPRSAVLTDARGAYVYQLNGTRAQRIAVTVRVENGDRYGVDGALDAARALVAAGNYELRDGAAVNVEGGVEASVEGGAR